MSDSDNSPVETVVESLPPTMQVDTGSRVANAFKLATIIAAAGLVATILGDALLVYWYELILSRSFWEYESLIDISKFSVYSLSIGLTLCLAAFALAVSTLKTVPADGRQARIVQSLKARLGTLLMLAIAMVTCAAISAVYIIYTGEWGQGSGEMAFRIRMYLPMFARVLAATALLIVTDALRTSNLKAAPQTHEE